MADLSWLKVDDKFPRHRRIRELRRDTAAKWLHVTALCFCSEHLTDGRIDDVDLPSIINESELTAAVGKRSINKLVGVGLWEDNRDGSYVIRDFLDYNPSSDEVKELRKSRSEAGRVGGQRSGETRRAIEATASIVDEALAEALASPGFEPQSPAQSLTPRPKSSGLLDNGRSEACNNLLTLVKGGDNGTPRVVERFCKQLPRDRIDRVASTLRLGVKPAIAVAALKREVKAYEAEVRAEGAA